MELEPELELELEPEEEAQDLREEKNYSVGANYLRRLKRHPSQSRTLRAATRELE